MAEVTMENVEQVFSSVPVDEGQQKAIKHIQDKFIELAKEIISTVPRCADRSAVIRDLRCAKMFCTDAIAKGGLI